MKKGIKILIFLAIIIFMIILSGCIDKPKAVNNTDRDNDDRTDFVENNKISIKDDIKTDNIKDSINNSYETDENNVNKSIKRQELSSSTGSTSDYISNNDVEWCKANEKIIVTVFKNQEEFIIKGITNYNDKEVCKAERLFENGVSTRYFSKDGKYVVMTSLSSSSAGSANAYSEAKAIGN